MPVRNGEKYIRRAVASTLQALPRDAELVILNDASSDGTAEILASLITKQVRIIQTETSKGIAAGLNRLFDETDSEYVARMDADNVTLPWRFSKGLRQLEDVDVVFSAIIFMRANGSLRRPDLPGPIGPTAFPLHLALASCFCHPTMMGRRSVFEAHPYRAIAAEDYDLWLRLAAAGTRMMRDPLPGLLYRVHDLQTSASVQWQERRRIDNLNDPRSWESYCSLLESIGIGDRLPHAVLDFAQSGVVSERDAKLAVGAFLSRIQTLALETKMGRFERLTLEARIRSLRRRTL